MNTWPPRRVRVVGTSGAGKTTFARTLAGVLGVPHRELDEVFWDRDWTRRDPAVAREVLRELDRSGTGWVVDGNWRDARAGVLEDADLVVWLDYARPVVMARVMRRTLRRMLLREELWHGNREDPRRLLSTDPGTSIVLWAWVTHGENRRRYSRLASHGPAPVVRLRTPRAARRWTRTLR